MKDNGIIIFDNSDWHKDTKKELDKYDLINCIFMDLKDYILTLRQLHVILVKSLIKKQDTIFMNLINTKHQYYEIEKFENTILKNLIYNEEFARKTAVIF